MRASTPAGKREPVLVPRAYVFTLSLTESSDGTRLPVKFALRLEDTSGASRAGSQARIENARLDDLRAELELLTVQMVEMQKRVDVGVARPEELHLLQARQGQLQRRIADASNSAGHGGLSSGRGIIDTGFMMVPGETVVVGTSRLGGDKALIALVTAVRRTGGGR
jgi:hypothetical protein